GDYPVALDSLEKSWEIAERNPWIYNQNRALLDLVRAELFLEDQSTNRAKGATPGKWLSKLEDYAINRDLPGIRMQAALLKSEFYKKHGQLKDAHATLQEALGITDSLGVKTLRGRISSRIQELERLMHDEELDS
ncbi:MAG: hypothetical protein ACXAAR_01285, partial [Candidatus Thorarchaeota archaeon]